MSETIGYAISEGVATLTLQRPDKLNAFNDDMLGALEAALKQAERDPEVRCVVITGAGRGFSAGQDLSAVQDRDASGGMSFREHLEKTYNRVIRKIRTMEKPVIGGVNGVAAGAGASLALACDLRVASENASFIQSFIGVGLVPDSGSTFYLPRMIGFARAFELAITAERLPAEEALRIGLVNRVVGPDAFATELQAYAAKIAAAPTKAIGLTKRAMNRALCTDLDSALSYEAQLQEIAGRSFDHREGIHAFLEKRPPNFKGR
jgi:2-(1,2-epoxy-1,2-dihydrophenyl)acetyl-CoA isomerase